MKFIGNQIYQWISRFRNDVYLEDLSTSTEQSYLVVDSEGKITKRTTLNSGSNDITTTGDVNSTNVIITGEIRGPATTVIDPAPVGDNNGVLQIKGDLQVDGTTTTINSTTLTVDDKNIVLSSGSTTSLASDGAGITIDGASATLTYAHSDTSWNFNKPLNVSGDVKTDSNIIIPSDGFLKTSNNNFNFIELYNGSDASMRFRMGHSSVGRFQFLNSSDTEVFTIDARNERVGIGTTSPNRTLTIDTTSSNAMEIRRSGTRRIMSDASGSNGGWVFTGSGGNKFAVGANGNDFQIIDGDYMGDPNGTERLRILQNGNVGIGQTSPAHKLDVAGYIRSANTGADSNTKYSQFLGRHYTNSEEDVLAISTESTSSNNNIYIGGGFSSRNSATTIRFSTAANNTTTTGTERMRITSDGSVGIGTDSPSQLIDVASSGVDTNAPTIRITNTANNNASNWSGKTSHAIEFHSTDPSRVGLASSIKNIAGTDKGGVLTGNITFNTADWPTGGIAERMRITDSGFVGIGITNPANPLSVQSASNTIARFTSTDNRGNILIEDDDTSGYVVAEGGTLGFGFSASQSANNINVDSSNNNVGIGTTSPSEKLDVSGNIKTTGNITFGDSHFIGDDSFDNLHILGSSGENVVVQAQGSTSIFLKNDSTSSLILDSSSNATFAGAATIPSQITAGYGIKFTNGNTDFLLYNNSGENVLYMRDTTNGAMITTWKTDRFQSDKDFVAMANATVAGNLNVGGALTLEGTTDQILNLKVTDNGAVYHAYLRGSDRHAYVGFGGSGDTFSIANEESGGSVRILSGGSLALNIASDQTATFEGTVKSKGTLSIENTFPQIALTDTNHDDDWRIRNNNGDFEIYNETDNQMYFRADEDIVGIQLGDGVNFRGSSVPEPDWDGSSTTQNSGHSGTIVKNMFFNPASEGDPARLPHIVNDLSGFTFWGTITTSGFYSTRSGSSGSFTYSNEITNTNGGWVNAFDGFSSTAGSWYSDNGADGTTAGVGTVELQWTNEATYGFWVGIVFGSNSFIATRVKIEAYQTDAGWQTLCDLTDNNEIVVLRKVKGNSGTGQGTTRIKYTLGGSTNNSYFRIHTLYAASYQAGNVNLSGQGLEKVRGIQYLQKYGNGQIWGHFRPAQDGVYDLGSSSLEWNNGYFDGTVYADGLSLATTTISASGSTYNLNNFLRADQNDVFNGKLVYGGSDFSDAIDLSEGDLNNANELNAYEFKQRNTGEPRSNLGTPTVTEMALFEQQFKPQTTLANNYDDLTDLKFFIQETSSSSMTEVTSYSDDNKRKFLRTNNSGVIIPNGTYKFRVQFKAHNYTFVNALYGYFATQSHKTKVHVYKFNVASNSEINHTLSDTQISSWPGHLFLPMSQIPWHETNTTSTNHHRDVIIEFIPEWIPYSGSGTDYSDRHILLYGLQLWGGYPVGRRTPHSYDQNGKLDLFGDLGLKDNGKITLGDSDDLQIFHVSGNSYIDDAGTGDLILRTNGTAVRIQHAGEMIFKGIANGAVESYHNNSKKFETNAGGVTVFPTGAAGIQMGVDSSNSVLSGRLFFENGTSGQGNTIFNNTGNLIFCTGATHGSSSGSEKIRLLANGNLGIGTASPEFPLDVKGAVNALQLTNSDYSSGSAGSRIRFTFGSSTGNTFAKIQTTDAGGVSASNLILQSDSGLVGVGTESPGSIMEVNGGSADGLKITAGNSAGEFSLNASTSNGTSRLWVGGTGNVGINTVTPHNKTHIVSTSSGDGLLIDCSNGSNNNFTGVYFKIDNNTTNAYKKGGLVWERTGSYNEGRFHFLLNNEDNVNNVGLSDSKMTILSTGNVGIGTDSPTHKLEVREGDVHFENTSSSNTFVDAKGSSANAYFRAFSDSNSVWLYQGGTSSYLSAQSGSTLRINSGTTDLILSDNSSAVLSFNSSNATFAGDVRLPQYGKVYLWTGHDANYLAYNLWTASASAGMTIQNSSNAGEIYLKSGNALTLTLDDSQNATFAGDITVGPKSNATVQVSESGGADVKMRAGSVGRVGTYSNHNFIITQNSVDAITIDTSRNATFAGNVTTGASLISTNAIVSNVTAKGASSNITFKNNAGSTIAQFYNDLSAAFLSNVTISGNLTVNGTTVTVNTTNLNVQDKNITLNYSAGDSSSTANGAGITIQDAVDSSTDATILWDATNDEFDFSHGATFSGPVTVGVDDSGHDVIFYGATSGKYMQWDESNDYLNFRDSTKIMLGNSNDLQLSHNGTDSYIENVVGHLYIKNTADDKDIIFQSDDGSGGVATYMTIDGSTTNVGIGTTSPGYKLHVSGGGLQTTTATGNRIAYYDGSGINAYGGSSGYAISNYHGDLSIVQNVDDGNIIFKSDDGSGGTATYFFLDGANTRTEFLRDIKFPDNVKANFGTSVDLQIYHDGSNSYIKNETGNLNLQNNADDADIAFYCDDQSGSVAEYFRLDGSLGINRIFKALRANDDVKFQAGSGGDLDIVHSGTAATIENKTGNLTIKNSTDDGDIIFQSDDGSGGTTAYITIDGSSALTQFNKKTRHYDNVKGAFGNGGDMYLQHDGTNSVIVNTNGNLTISNQADDKDIIFSSDDGSGGVTTYMTIDGSEGHITVQKEMHFQDTVVARFGTDNDAQIVHSGSNLSMVNQTGNFNIVQNANDGDITFQCDDGSGGTETYFKLDGSTGFTQFADSKQLTFGAGDDLKIQHNGTNSEIGNFTGSFNIYTHTDDGDINFMADDGSGGITNYFVVDGSAEQTRFYKDTRHTDGIKANFGNSDDLQIVHDGFDSYVNNFTGNLNIVNRADDKDIIFQSDDGSGGVETYFFLDGSESVVTFPDDKRLTFGTGRDLFLYHTGTGMVMKNFTGDMTIRNEANDKDIIFQSDDGSGGVTDYIRIDGSADNTKIYKDLRYQDNVKAKFGAVGDLEIYHDGSNSYITDSGTGDLLVSSFTLQGTGRIQGVDTVSASTDAANKFYVDSKKESFVLACSDETTDLTASSSVAKVTFRMPYAFNLSAVRASVSTAPAGSTITVDVKKSGTSIFSTALTIDAGEKTSTTASTAAVIANDSLSDDEEITVFCTQIGSSTAGKGLKVTLIGNQ